MNIYQPGLPTIEFMTSADTAGQDDLLIVRYKRCQPESPVFLTQFDGIDQSVDIKITTFIFRAAPEPVLAVYDFVMTTFVPAPAPNQQPHEVALVGEESSTGHSKDAAPVAVVEQQQAAQKIRVLVNLASVQGNLPTGVVVHFLTPDNSNLDEQRREAQCPVAVHRERQRLIRQQHDASGRSPRKPEPDRRFGNVCHSPRVQPNPLDRRKQFR